MKTRKFKKKTPKNQKTSTFKYNEVSVLIIWVSVSVSNPGVGASDIVSLLLLEALFMQISGVSLAPSTHLALQALFTRSSPVREPLL
jgi:hypothetical protein